MVRNRKTFDKRKKTNSSGDECALSKQFKAGGPTEVSGELSNVCSETGSDTGSDTGSQNNIISVSELLNQTNSVLFNESVVFAEDLADINQISLTDKSGEMADAAVITSTQTTGTTNADIIALLQKIDSRLEKVETKLEKLDKLEEKVGNVESEIKKLWLHVDKTTKAINDKVTVLDTRMDNAEFQDGRQQSKLDQLEAENNKLKDTMSYLQSQSMRNNLVFCNIAEEENEKPEDTERILREFMVVSLKMAQEQVDSIKFERAHRIGGNHGMRGGGPRNIVCKFTLFKDREAVKKQRVQLKGTRKYINEQFPTEIVAKRKMLTPHLKKAKAANKKAYIAYDTLYVDGKAVKID